MIIEFCLIFASSCGSIFFDFGFWVKFGSDEKKNLLGSVRGYFNWKLRVQVLFKQNLRLQNFTAIAGGEIIPRRKMYYRCIKIALGPSFNRNFIDPNRFPLHKYYFGSIIVDPRNICLNLLNFQFKYNKIIMFNYLKDLCLKSVMLEQQDTFL